MEPLAARYVSTRMIFVLLTLVLLNPDIACLFKQCRSRSVGLSQLIWICTVCHLVCEFISTIWINESHWLKIRIGHGILIYPAGQGLRKKKNSMKLKGKKLKKKMVWLRGRSALVRHFQLTPKSYIFNGKVRKIIPALPQNIS